MRSLLLFTLILLTHGIGSYAQDTREKYRLNGSTTVTNLIFSKHQKDIEQSTATTLAILPTNSGRGVAALADGETDIAMVSIDLGLLFEELNKKRDTPLNVEDFKIHPIDMSHIIFIVHPNNPIEHLTNAQLKRIFSGEGANWSEFGVDGLGEIKIITEHNTGGMHNLVKKNILDKGDFPEDRITMQNAPQAIKVLSQLPNAITFVSNATPSGRLRTVKTIKTDINIAQNLAFLTKKNENRSKLIDIINAAKTKVTP